MDRRRWQRIQDLFAQAIELDTDRRDAFLTDACADDPDLRREIDSLLGADAQTDSLVDQPLFDLHPEPAPSPEGRRIGSYKIVKELGRGGLGTVYLAERIEFEQCVALKVIKRGMDTDEVVRRFHQERQILANLEHPHIARLLDGGSTDDGLPYFVMELVDGERLDRYCETHGLGVGERLRLFLQVCSAVQLAHRNLIVHRDLKPSNILVTRDGPKLLDFGIAKLLTPDAAEARTRLTELGSTPMTPDYASPEQARGEAVTTASDVYSLGVILRELLDGGPPAWRPRTERDPTRRARSVSRSARGMPGRRPPRDLESIAGKALRDEPEHRYGSVDQLADDLRRYLDGRPVLAREGAAFYRVGKFLRRHRRALLTAAALTVLIALGIAFEVTSRRESARRVAEAELSRQLSAERVREANRQAQIRSELLGNLFTAPDLRGRESFTLGQLLARGEARVRGNLKGEPLATQLEILGRLWGDLDETDKARALLEDTLELRRQLYDGDHPLLARVINNLAASHYLAGDYQRAEALYEEAVEMRRRLGQDDVDLVTSMSNLASIHMNRGDYDRAENLYRRALSIRRQAYGERDPAVASSLRSLGTLLYLRGHAEDAEPLLRQALEIRRQAYGERDTRVASAQSSLGRALQALGHEDEAKRLLTSVLDTRRELLGEDHPHVALTKKDLASLVLDRQTALDRKAVTVKELADVERLLAEALEVLRTWKSGDSWQLADAESLWGLCLSLQGRRDEALPFLKGGYQRLRELRGDRAIHTRKAYQRLGELNKK